MGQGQSAFMAPANTVLFDLYGGGSNGCGDNSCSRPTFEHAMYHPNVPLSEGEFMEFKQRVCAVTSQYREMTKAQWIPLVVGLVICVVIQAVFPGGAFTIIVVAVIWIAILSRVVNHNMRVDHQIHALTQEFNARYAGRVTFTYVTRNTGLCKPKHSRVERVIWLTNNQGMTMMPGMQPMQMQSAPVMGMGQPVQMAGAQPPYAAGATPGTVPAYYPAPAYPAPGSSAPAPAYPALGSSAPAPAYPAPPSGVVPSVQEEVFCAKVPAGVNGGDTFETKTPSGRTVTVEAPNGAREGMEFQVNA